MTNTRVTTGKDTRFSYVKLITPSELSGKYEASVLIPKSDTETHKKILAAIEAAKLEAKDRVWKGKIPPKFKSEGLQDGDDKYDKNGDPDANYAGHWFLQARGRATKDKSTGKVTPQLPFLCDKNRVQVEPSVIYSGCYGIASLAFFGYDFEGSKGIGVELRGIQFLRDGEPLGGGGGNVANDFEEFDDEDSI